MAAPATSKLVERAREAYKKKNYDYAIELFVEPTQGALESVAALRSGAGACLVIPLTGADVGLHSLEADGAAKAAIVLGVAAAAIMLRAGWECGHAAALMGAAIARAERGEL